MKIVFCDIDGCMGNFVKSEYPFKQDTSKNEEEFERIKKRIVPLAENGILFGVCTGRSFYQADHIMSHTGHQGPSIFEMGNVIFEPDRGVYNLFEEHEKFRDKKEIIRRFIEWKKQMTENEKEIKDKFQDANLRQIKDRTCMLTYEFERNIGKELFIFLVEKMPDVVKQGIQDDVLTVLFSRNALDILPNINKGDAVSFLINKYNIDKKNVLAIGDSSHSDLPLLQSAGMVACPDNADEEMKKYVLEHNGFVVPNSSSTGLLNILDLVESFIKFSTLKNES
ncbi:MAG TPA: HAD family hydrolase [Patescibacteria group bacterium]|nr:HAD family hydrolase [Patescibacteria group bacterium]